MRDPLETGAGQRLDAGTNVEDWSVVDLVNEPEMPPLKSHWTSTCIAVNTLLTGNEGCHDPYILEVARYRGLLEDNPHRMAKE